MLTRFYKKLDHDQRVMFWLIVLGIVVFLALVPLYLLGLDKGYSYPNGWLFGTIFELIACYSLIRMSKSLMDKDKENSTVLVVANSFLRPFIYVVVLSLSAVSTFKPEWLGGFDAFNFYTSLAGLLPMSVAFFLVHLFSARKGEKK